MAVYLKASKISNKLAIHGGMPVRTRDWPQWPIRDRDAEDEIFSVLGSGNWWMGRDTKRDEFEQKYAELLGTKHDMDDIADAILKIYENRDSLLHS
jgi:hypothetical protein